jgi:hypothetical protein
MASPREKTTYATTELEMAMDARLVLLAEGAGQDWLDANQRQIDKYRRETSSPIPAQAHEGNRRGNGNGSTASRSDHNQPRQPQLDFATSLMHRLWYPDTETARELSAKLKTRTRPEVSRIIDNLQSLLADQPRAATPDQTEQLRTLWHCKMARVPEADQTFEERIPTFTFDEAAKMLAALRDMANVAQAAAPATTARTPAAKITEGMYKAPDGTIFKVVVAHHGSGQLYAQRMTRLDTPRLVRGKEVLFGFQYAPGSINRISPTWKMGLADAKEFGDLYGACCRCGTVLTDDESIAQGVGPVCITKF